MRYFKEKETGDIIMIDETDKKSQDAIKNALANRKYTEWFIYIE